MNCAPFGLTSVTSSWKPSCLRRTGRTSFSKRLLNSFSLPFLMWNWTLRAYLMTLLPVTLEQVDFIGEPERKEGRRRQGTDTDLDLVKRYQSITHRVSAFAAPGRRRPLREWEIAAGD